MLYIPLPIILYPNKNIIRLPLNPIRSPFNTHTIPSKSHEILIQSSFNHQFKGISTIKDHILWGVSPYIGLIYGRYLQSIGSWNGHWPILVGYLPGAGSPHRPMKTDTACFQSGSCFPGRQLRIYSNTLLGFLKSFWWNIHRLHWVLSISWIWLDPKTFFSMGGFDGI